MCVECRAGVPGGDGNEREIRDSSRVITGRADHLHELQDGQEPGKLSSPFHHLLHIITFGPQLGDIVFIVAEVAHKIAYRVHVLVLTQVVPTDFF
jgi:hypothetical protein